MFRNIQAMRAIASILVVLYHFAPHFSIATGSSIPTLLFSKWAFFGVDIFFVISGFVIANSLTGKTFSTSLAVNFLSSRIIRIYSGYIPFVLLMIYVIYSTSPFYLEGLSIVNSVFLTSANQEILVLPVSWSLTFELYFYIIFLFLFFAFENKNKAFIVISLFHILINIFWFKKTSVIGSPYIVEFLAGAMIRINIERIYMIKMRTMILILPAAIAIMILGVCASFGHGNGRVLTLGAVATYIILFIVYLERFGYLFNRHITKLGDSSYAIYLSHLIFISLFYVSGIRDALPEYGSIISFTTCVIFIISIVIFSYLYSKFIEIPFYKLLKSRLNSSKHEVAA